MYVTYVFNFNEKISDFNKKKIIFKFKKQTKTFITKAFPISTKPLKLRNTIEQIQCKICTLRTEIDINSY